MTNPHDIIKKPVVTEQSMMEMAEQEIYFRCCIKMQTRLK